MASPLKSSKTAAAGITADRTDIGIYSSGTWQKETTFSQDGHKGVSPISSSILNFTRS